MRLLYVLACTVLVNLMFSQAPPVINYQGVARSASGDPIVNTTIGLKFEILQGSSAGSTVFSEEQSVYTGTFGVFSVRIGTTTSAGISSVNWGTGPFFLKVSIDLANAQSYTVLGVQEIVSVPYAMYAGSVPASYKDNILSVGSTTMAIENQSLSLVGPNTLSISGSNSVEIAPSLSYTNSILTVGPPTNTLNLPVPPATSLLVTGGGAQLTSTATNEFSLNVPAVVMTPSTNVSINGTYPDFTVSATPSLSLLGPNTLSISGGNSVGIAPTIALTGNSLSVGTATNFVTLPTPTVTGTGAASVNTAGFNYIIDVPQTTLTPGGGINIVASGTNSFILSVPVTTLNNGNNVTVTGTNNNFVIHAQPTLNLLSANTLSISHGNFVTLAPTLGFNGNVLNVGPASNTVIIPTNSTTILGGGAVTASVISANTYSVYAPLISLSSGSNISIGGSSDFTINAIPVFPTVTANGVVSINPPSGPNMTVTVPDPVLTSGGNTIAISQGTASSFVNVPPPVLSASGNSVSAGGNTITIPTYTVSGGNISMTPGPDHTITVNQINPTFSTTGIVNVSPSTGTFFTVSVPDPVLSTSGNSIAISQGTASSAVSVPAPVLSLINNSLSAGANTVNIPVPVYNGANGVLTTGTSTTNITPTMQVSGSVLTVGPAGNTITLPASSSTITQQGVALVTPSTGNNFTVNVPPPVLISGGNTIAISQGSASSVASIPPPVLSVSGSSLSAGANTVIIPSPVYNSATGDLSTGSSTTNITQSVQVNGNVLTIGPTGNSVTLPPTTATITQQGVALVSPSTGNNFTVNVPAPLLSSGGNTIAITQGSTSSTVNVPPPVLTMSNNSLTAGANTVTIPTPSYNAVTGDLNTGSSATNITPSVQVSGNVLTVGPSGNSVTLPPTTATITQQGVALVSPSTGNNFTVNVPAPLLSSGGNTIAITQGTASSAVNVPPPVLTLSNNSLSAGANTVTIPTPSYNAVTGDLNTGSSATNITPSVQVSGGVLTVGPSGNSVTLPPTSATITPDGIAAVTPSTGNNFTVSVPPPVLSSGGNTLAITQGTANSTVTVPPPVLTLSNNSLTAGANTVNIPTPNYNGSTGVLTTGSFSTDITPTLQIVGNVLTVGPAANTVLLPPSSSTIQQSGIAQVSPSTGDNFTVHVPPAVYNAGTGVLSQGTATQNITQVLTLNTNTLSAGPASNSIVLPGTNLVGTGAVTTTNGATSNTIHVPIVQITGVNNASVTNNFPNFIVDVPTPTITGAGMAIISPSATGNNFVVNVAPGYTPATGVLGGGTHTVNITPVVTFTNNIVTVGPSTNSVNISGVSPWTQSASAVVLTNPSSNVGIGTNTPQENLQVETSSGGASLSIISPSPQTSSLLFGRPGAHNLGRIEYSMGGNTMDIFSNNKAAIHIDPNGNVGIKNNFPSPNDLTVFNSGNTASIRISNTVSPSFGLEIAESNTAAIFMNHETTPMFFGTSGVNRVAIDQSGNVGIGTLTPTSKLHVDMTSSIFKIADYPVGTGPILNTILTGEFIGKGLLAPQLRFQQQSSTDFMDIGQNAAGDLVVEGTDIARFAVRNTGNVGIGTSVPTENLQIESATSGAQLSIVSPSPQASSLTFGNPASHNQGRISYQNTGDNMIFSTSSTDRMTVTGIGRVGIGNMAPQENLQVETTGNTAVSIISGTASTLFFGNASSHVRGALRYDNSNNSFNFWTNNTPNRMVISNTGNVGIGTANPGLNAGAAKYLSISSTTVLNNSPAAIEIEGAYTNGTIAFGRLDFNSWGAGVTSTNVARVSAYNGNSAGMGALGFSTRDGNNLIERMRIDETGKVRIGSTTNNATLQVIDGNQGTGKVLTSDAAGNASWMDVLPAGMVMAYAGNVVPNGWLLCDGSAYPKTLYPNLWAAIGTSWGVPATTTDFYVPDMRGMFLRGHDGGSGNDPNAIFRAASKPGGPTGNAVGTYQSDENKSHSHNLSLTSTVLSGLGVSTAVSPSGNTLVSDPSGGAESRPKNVYVKYIIKY